MELDPIHGELAVTDVGGHARTKAAEPPCLPRA
jgi:hypothetical protein